VSEEDGWYDEAAGPLVRPYTITGGRTPADTERLDLSIAEIAAYVKVPVGVIRVLCGDLIQRGLVITRSPNFRTAQAPSHETLQAVIDALTKL
jgi:hypothetical protein